MRCPFCDHIDDKVIDSRQSKDGDVIRRRRDCLKCEGRFTSYERIDDVLPHVVKKDNRREAFDRNKILRGLEKACEKRPISVEVIENLVSDLERELQETGEREINSKVIGEKLISKLYEIDEVAYVRFASVYRSFKDVNQFMDELKELLKEKDE